MASKFEGDRGCASISAHAWQVAPDSAQQGWASRARLTAGPTSSACSMFCTTICTMASTVKLGCHAPGPPLRTQLLLLPHYVCESAFAFVSVPHVCGLQSVQAGLPLLSCTLSTMYCPVPQGAATHARMPTWS